MKISEEEAWEAYSEARVDWERLQQEAREAHSAEERRTISEEERHAERLLREAQKELVRARARGNYARRRDEKWEREKKAQRERQEQCRREEEGRVQREKEEQARRAKDEQDQREREARAKREREEKTQRERLNQRAAQKRQDEAMLNRWAQYQTTLGTNLTFNSIIWPVLIPPTNTSGLTLDAIRAFLLSDLHSRDRTPKQRLNDALRRWHSDKRAAVINALANPQDEQLVVDAFHQISIHLNHLKSTLS